MKTITSLEKTEKWDNGKKRDDSQESFTDKVEQGKDGLTYVQRTIREMENLPGDALVINPPAPKKLEINWLSTLLPSCTTISISVVMAIMMGNSRMMIYTLPMTMVGLLLTFVNYFKAKKQYRLGIEKAEEYLEVTEKKLKELQRSQREILMKYNPKPDDCMRILQTLKMKRFWVRQYHDPDFGCAKIGRGTIAGSYSVTISGSGNMHEQTDQQKKAAELKKKYCMVPEAPVTCDFFHPFVCGITGSSQSTDKMIHNILLQLAVSHCYTDLQMVVIGGEEHAGSYAWTKKLPHTQGGGLVSFGQNSLEGLLDTLFEQLKERSEQIQENKASDKKTVILPRYLVVLLEPELLKKDHEISKYLFREDLGISVVVVTKRREQLLQECQQIILLDGDDGVIYHKSNSSHKQAFHMDSISMIDFEEFGNLMKPLAVKQSKKEEEIPTKYTFYQMLGISGIDQLNLANRWTQSNVLESMRVPIGITRKNKPMTLDVRAEGPHGLVAGFTGSGKSELLISYILSMAANFSPVDVNFFLIDYKSALPNQLQDLPHTVGFVRDIDDESLSRYLISLTSEIQRRKRIFDEVLKEEKNISNYIAMFKAGRVTEAIPYLLIVVDEFYELKRDRPEFIKELVSVALVGRSLGVHLILATQLPSGVVDEQISGNSNFRICLYQKNAQESQSVIGSTAAARIKNAGRGYLRIGNDEIVPFQSGYSGGADPDYSDQTQRAAVIRSICRYCETVGIEKRRNLYLPALPKKLPYANSDRPGNAIEKLRVPIGYYDAPELQAQPLALLELSGKNTLIIGSSNFGKTNLLQTIIRSLTHWYTPAEVNLYILDFNSMFLRNYDGLPHVGGAVLEENREKVVNLFRMLVTEIEIRRKKISNSGLTSFDSYLEAGYRDLPHIVLMVDNYMALRLRYLVDEDPLLKIMTDGPSRGISVILTNSQKSGIPHGYEPVINNKIALFCSDSNQYYDMFGYTKTKIPEISGRFVAMVNGLMYEGQSYLAFEGKKEIDRYHSVMALVEQSVKQYPNQKAKQIPAVPEKVTHQYIYREYQMDISRMLALGVDYRTVSPIGMELESQFMLSIVGKNPAKKKMILSALVKDVLQNHASRPAKVLFLDTMKKEYSIFQDMPYVDSYFCKADDICTILEKVSDELEMRSELMDGGTVFPLLLVVINNKSAMQVLSESKTHMKMFENISKNYREQGVLFVFADVDNENAGYGAPEILKKIKDERKALLFDPVKESKLFDISIQQQKSHTIPLGTSDAYYLYKDTVHRIKLIEE